MPNFRSIRSRWFLHVPAFGYKEGALPMTDPVESSMRRPRMTPLNYVAVAMVLVALAASDAGRWMRRQSRRVKRDAR
jgi:hypothetical protein